MNFNNIHNVYLLGIGGIGMSALAKYFKLKGCNVAGYDRTQSALCDELSQAGINIHYSDDISLIPKEFTTTFKEHILIIFTPAIPQNHREFIWFKENNFTVKKRAEVLGEITLNSYTIAVAGTHGKTTISTCLAHIYNQLENGCNAFLGGISKNYHTNFPYAENGNITIVEADEYDRSFLQLLPSSAIVTAVDADHLDIYNNYQNVVDAFTQFAQKVKENGKLLIKKESKFNPKPVNANVATYSVKENADCTISDLQLYNGKFTFNLHTPWGNIEKLTPGITGMFNVENVAAAASMCIWEGIDFNKIKSGIETFLGVKRRFDVQAVTTNSIYIDDYAHHPEELKAFISSVRGVYPKKQITGIFQPHLYTRTRDFADGFGEALSLLDKLILLDIYPARELPIQNITSKTILEKVKIKDKTICTISQLFKIIKKQKPELLLTMGAGDIAQLVEPLKNIILS